MSKRITVTALKPVQYDGRSHVRGAVFTATPVDAAALKYRGKVKFGGQLTQPAAAAATVERATPVPGPARAPAEVATVADSRQTEQPETSAPDEAPTEPAGAEDTPSTRPARATRAPRGGRGTYNRRDMNAEPLADTE